jgi:hypothetical protein
MVERVRFDDDRAADRRECSVCGEQWIVPVVSSADLPSDIEAIELSDDAEQLGDSPDDGVEEWFR